MRLLVCDDDVVVRMALGMALDGVEVVETYRGGEVLPAARKLAPDAVVVDLRLPDGDGLDVVKALRGDPATSSVVVIVLTAGHDPAKRESVLAAGADEYLAKPFEPLELGAIVRRLLALPPDERHARRGVHRARLHAGRDDGGISDLPPDPAAAPDDVKSGRRWGRRP